MTTSSLPRNPSALPIVWSWQERLAGHIDSALAGRLNPFLQLFTGGAFIQYQTAMRPRLDFWGRDGVFHIVVGRFWLEVEQRGSPAQQAARKAGREAERKAAAWALLEREDFESGS